MDNFLKCKVLGLSVFNISSFEILRRQWLCLSFLSFLLVVILGQKCQVFKNWSVYVHFLHDPFKHKNEIHSTLPRWVSTENVDQSPANNNPLKQGFCLCKNQALTMKTVIAILLLILCTIQRLSTKKS